MKLSNRFAPLAFLILLGVPARAQLKDMPSQAEFDPILDRADSNLKDFAATLTEFRAEAAEIDRDRLDRDLKAIRQLREVIPFAHSAEGRTNKGLNMERLVGILSGVDDVTLDAAVWKSLAELKMCMQLAQNQNAARYDQFATRVTMSLQILHEVGGELFHPTLRAAKAWDEILLTLTDAAPENKK